MGVSLGFGVFGNALLGNKAAREAFERQQQLRAEYYRRVREPIYRGALNVIDGECVEITDEEPVKLLEHKTE